MTDQTESVAGVLDCDETAHRIQATVVDAGGGEVRLLVDRDTEEYPEIGSTVEVQLIDGPRGQLIDGPHGRGMSGALVGMDD